MATIRFQRPDISVEPLGLPISFNPSVAYFQSVYNSRFNFCYFIYFVFCCSFCLFIASKLILSAIEIPNVRGELMQASFPPDINLIDFSQNKWYE
jgi:hypothetical protein